MAESVRKKRRRRWPIYLAAALLLGGIAVGAARERIAAWAASEVLAMRYGLPSSVSIDHLGSDQANIASLSLGKDGEVIAADIRLQFTPTAMRVDRIEIGRVAVHARYDGHAVTLGTLDPMLRELMAPGAGNGEQGPLPSIVLHKIEITIDTPQGTLNGDGMATIDQGVVYSQFALTEPEQRSAIHLDLNAALNNQSPQPQGKITAALKADSALWGILGLPQPTSGDVQLSAQLKVPPADAASGIRLATGAVLLAADWNVAAKALAWPGQPAPADLQGAGRAVLSERRLDLPNFDLKASGGWSPDLTLHLQGAALANLADGKVSAQSTVDFTGQAKAAGFGPVQVKSPAIDLGLQLQFAGDKLQIRPSRDGTIKFAQASVGPSLKFSKPVTLAVKRTDASQITVPVPPLSDAPIEGTLALGLATAELALPGLPGPAQVAIPSGTLGFIFTPADPLQFSFDAKNATVTLPQPGAAAKNLTINVKGAGGKIDATLTAGAVTGPSGTGPATLDGKAGLDGNKLSATMKLGLPAAKAVLSVKGGYDLGSGKGKFDIDLPPVTFVPGGLQPGDLLPSLKDNTESVAGTVAAKGPVTIEKGAVSSAIAVNLQGLSGKFGPITLRNLNSVIQVERPWPLTTAADQVMSVELADVGLPLTNGLVRFKVDDGTAIAITESKLEMMGGHVTLEPVTLKLGAPAQQIHLHVDKIAVHSLFQLFAVAGLDGDGVLSGDIPVTLFPAGLAIDHAKLEAEAPGQLNYDQAQAPAAIANAGDSVKMALSALSDFHYDRLEVDLDRAATGDTALGLHISGRNPSFYDGYPVEFNLTVTGRLDEALRKGLAGYQVPDMIRDRLKSFNH